MPLSTAFLLKPITICIHLQLNIVAYFSCFHKRAAAIKGHEHTSTVLFADQKQCTQHRIAIKTEQAGWWNRLHITCTPSSISPVYRQLHCYVLQGPFQVPKILILIPIMLWTDATRLAQPQVVLLSVNRRCQWLVRRCSATRETLAVSSPYSWHSFSWANTQREAPATPHTQRHLLFEAWDLRRTWKT